MVSLPDADGVDPNQASAYEGGALVDHGMHLGRDGKEGTVGY
jgi:hypothetical protein